MKKKPSYQSVLERNNALKEIVLNFFFALSSGPRLILEVFIRKNFGCRYFFMASAYTAAAILAIVPLISNGILYIFTRYGGYRFPDNFWLDHIFWYGFIAAFLVMSYKRNREVKNGPSIFDLAKYSYCTGAIDKRFYDLGGKKWTVREIETFVEPAFCFIIGVLILSIDNNLGWLIVISSICYSLSYRGAYYNGDNYIMDILDKQILGEGLVKNVLEGKQGEDANGVQVYGRLPVSLEVRRKLLPHFFEDGRMVSAEVI